MQSFRQTDFVARLRVDEGPWQEQLLTTLMVHNNQYVGQFRLFPEASVFDGRLNMLYGRLNPGDQLFEDLGILTGTYLFGRTTHLVARKLDIVLPTPDTLMVDGDLIAGVERVCYEAVPGRLRCCTGGQESGVRGQESEVRSQKSPGSYPLTPVS